MWLECVGVVSRCCCREVWYLKKDMQQMEWNWSSSAVGIPLGRVILVDYLNGAAL